MQLTENFGFLGDHDPELVRLGALAERYFTDDPNTALIKIRQFAELLSKMIAARHAVYEAAKL
jgi:type I restriction enzyme R subunit